MTGAAAARAAALRSFVSDTLSAATRQIVAAMDQLVAELEEAAAGQKERKLPLLELRTESPSAVAPLAEHEDLTESRELTDNRKSDVLASRSPSPVRHRGKRRPGRPRSKKHIVLKIRILERPETCVLSRRVLASSPVQQLLCPLGLQDSDFWLLLRSSFPQLDLNFDLLTSDRQRRLTPLAPLTPEEILRQTAGGTLYIRPKRQQDIQSVDANCSIATLAHQEASKDISSLFPEVEDSSEDDPDANEKEDGGVTVSERLKEEELLFPCQVCGAPHCSEAALVQHAWSHQDQSECGACGERVALASALKDHLLSCHLLDDCSQCGAAFLPRSSDVPQLCGACEAPAELTAAPKINAPSKLKVVLDDEFHLKEAPMPPGGRKSHLCGVCGKSLCDARSLSRHMMIHSEERPHGCHVCGKSFKLADTLHQHQKIHAPRQRSFLCDVCCKMFLSAQQLLDHMLTHSQLKCHRCDACGKSFARKTALMVHRRVHTGEAPYRCPHCGWAFRWRSNLKEHLKVHSGAKPFVCSVCGKACARKVYLTVHMRTHSGERPYRCSVCDKHFTQSHCLKTHMRSHQRATTHNSKQSAATPDRK